MGKDYVDETLVNNMNADDWAGIESWASGIDKWGVTLGDLKKAKSGQGFVFKYNRDDVNNILKDYQKSKEYTERHATLTEGKTEMDVAEVNKNKMRDLLLSLELGAPQGLVNTDPTLKAQFEKQSAPFMFDKNNPYIGAMQRQISQSDVDLRANMAQNLAARGLSAGGGETQRAIAEATTKKGQAMANLQGQDYLRQFGEWKDKSQRALANIGQAYGVTSNEYTTAEQQYYDTLARQAEEAAGKTSKSWLDNNWGNIATTALGAGISLIPGGAAVGVPMLASGAGNMLNTAINPNAVGSIYNKTAVGKKNPYVPVIPTAK